MRIDFMPPVIHRAQVGFRVEVLAGDVSLDDTAFDDDLGVAASPALAAQRFIFGWIIHVG